MLTASLVLSPGGIKAVSDNDGYKTLPISASKKTKKSDKFANCFIGDASDLGHLSQLGYDPDTGEFDVS